jgi:hypothetical protein
LRPPLRYHNRPRRAPGIGCEKLTCPPRGEAKMPNAGIHCCEDMKRNVEYTCDQHPNRSDCPDCLIEYLPRFRQYGILVHDGGSSMVTISYCPWCGAKLPDPIPLDISREQNGHESDDSPPDTL